MRRIFVFLLCAVVFVACGEDFSKAERALIRKYNGDIMPVMSIASKTDSLLLRQNSLKVSERMALAEEFTLLKRSMLSTVKDPQNEGVGIAAPQVGLLRRMVAVQRFDKAGEPFEFFLNPEIIAMLGENKPGGEGCLSVPDMRGVVSRSHHIVLRYRDVDFVEHTDTIEGFENMTREECNELGLNESMIHVDFMIGCDTMNIDAICEDGSTVAIFRNGNWAF